VLSVFTLLLRDLRNATLIVVNIILDIHSPEVLQKRTGLIIISDLYNAFIAKFYVCFPSCASTKLRFCVLFVLEEKINKIQNIQSKKTKQ
jgi:hypothetical protein